MLDYTGNTIILWVIGFIPQIVIALLLANWFTDIRMKIRGKQFFKVVIYLPNLIMASAFAMLFFALFSVMLVLYLRPLEEGGRIWLSLRQYWPPCASV